jgi:hypothetical protein
LPIFVRSATAGDEGSPAGILKTGAELWAEISTMCHEGIPRSSFTREQSDAAMRHMREQANLTPEEQEAVLEFLKSQG